MTDEDVNKIGGMVDSKLETFREDLKGDIDSALEPVKDRLSNVEGHFNDPKTGLKRINQKLDALWDQTVRLTEDTEEVKNTVNKLEGGVDRMDRKLDRVIDTNIDYGNRVEDIEQIPVIAHELKLKRHK